MFVKWWPVVGASKFAAVFVLAITGLGWVGLYAQAPSGELAQIGGGPLGFDPDSDAARYLELRRSQREAALSPEVKEIHMAQQYGLSYLPLMVLRQYNLIEKHASAAWLGNIKVNWTRYPSGEAMNSALQAGLLDFASGGVAPLLRIWDQTAGVRDVKGIAALNSMPLFLNTTDPSVKSIKDFRAEHRIALPAVGTSVQAVTLQMAAAQTFGMAHYGKLDELTVSMSHPVGLRALISGENGVAAHLTSPPFQYQELEDPRVHTVLTSYQLLGGPSTFTAVWTRSEFFEQNPNTFRAVYAALREAMEIIRNDARAAAKIYVAHANSDLSVDFVQSVIDKPTIDFTVVPRHIMDYAQFMYETGVLKQAPQDWRDVFFPLVHGERGS